MTIKERAQKLRAADAIIKEVRDSLSRRAYSCAGCGHKRYHDWEASQMRDRLNACNDRIDQVVKWLGRIAAEGRELKTPEENRIEGGETEFKRPPLLDGGAGA